MNSILNFSKDDSEDYYSILGCSEHSNCDQIMSEYKARVLDCHPDKHPDDLTAHEKFATLLRAKQVLLNERLQYDQWRNSGVAMTYKQWAAYKNSVGMTMHWAYKKPDPMLPSTADGTSTTRQPNSSAGQQAAWRHDDVSDALRKFRNYQI